jgi:hypothetical protein
VHCEPSQPTFSEGPGPRTLTGSTPLEIDEELHQTTLNKGLAAEFDCPSLQVNLQKLQHHSVEKQKEQVSDTTWKIMIVESINDVEFHLPRHPPSDRNYTAYSCFKIASWSELPVHRLQKKTLMKHVYC